MTDIAVEVREVTKRFPGPAGEMVTAVKKVSLQIKDGEFFSMLGPSGCGKTTTLRMIAGFELPTEGDIYIMGKGMGQTPPYQRPVNTVFQSYALFPHLTIEDNVAFGLQMKKVAKAQIAPRVTRALEMVRLPGYHKRYPKQLSGGQQQRVALARALVNEPEVLLLDEPLGALDQKLRKEMQLELKRLQREVGITFVFVTHDQEEALTMSDRIAVMNHGIVLQIGTANEIYENPNCKYVADFIGETNFFEGTVREKTGRIATIDLLGGFTARADTDKTLTNGQTVWLSVRPEKISLRALKEDENQYAARVEELVDIGTDTHYIVRLSNDHRLRVREQNGDPMSRPLAQIGDTVNLTFDALSARLLTE